MKLPFGDEENFFLLPAFEMLQSLEWDSLVFASEVK
jgi:hypothetical protein